MPSCSSLTGVAHLEDIVAYGSWDLIGNQKLLKPRSTTWQANEAFRDGHGQMGTRKKGESAVLVSAFLQGDPEPKRSRWRGVLVF